MHSRYTIPLSVVGDMKVRYDWSHSRGKGENKGIPDFKWSASIVGTNIQKTKPTEKGKPEEKAQK